MKFLNKNARLLVFICDILTIPAWILLRWLSLKMLSTQRPCTWTLFGLQCATCGGTRCVKNFLLFNFIEAFKYNPVVFFGIIYLILTLIFLNLAFVFKVGIFKRILKYMYSIPSLLIWVGTFLMFIAVRNIPWLIRFLEYIIRKN
ncbi:MAG: DUF2752 domain-containing protein [Ruminococcaceae bacterium]|nr:DUF2752 domain-containing protein [Oscillospiraceae bacterium]